MQDVNDENRQTKIQDYPEITIQPQDMISIVVSSKTPELALPFNLQNVGESTSGQMGYTVNKTGDIDFPVLGTLNVAGLTRSQLTQFIKGKIIAEGYINDPVITVQFLNLRIIVNGEVSSPGTYKIESDHITIFEALSMAGDLTIYGKRDNVKIVREKNEERTVYEVDLRTAKVFDSPVFYLQQNDIIYVTPSKYRANQSTSASQVQQITVWLSVVTVLTTLAVIIFR
jgi:polysaccharide export outer membrane protein